MELHKQIACFFIDIFPYDHVKNKNVLGKVLFFERNVALRLLQYKLGYEMWLRSSHKYIHMFLEWASNLFTVSFLKRVICKSQIKESKTNSLRVKNFNSAYHNKEWFDYDGIEQIPFDGYEFNVPQNWNQLLTNMYGDYMRLPPIKKHGDRHKPIEADIGKYKIRNSARLNIVDECNGGYT